MNFQKKLKQYQQKIIVFYQAEYILQAMMDFKNMFVYQPTFSALELKNDKGTKNIINWKSKGIYSSKLMALNGAFLPSVKYLRSKIGI